MRILQVLPHLSKGGAECVVVELSNALIEAGHEVALLLGFPVDPALNQQFLDERVTVQFVSQTSANQLFVYLNLPFWILRNWKVLKSYEVIHCHLTLGLVFGAFISLFRKFTRAKNLRLIATCHVVGLGISRARRVINEKLSYSFDVFALMAQDAQWRNFILTKKRENIQIVVNGISPSIWFKKSKQPSEKDFWTIGTISRLQAERMPWLFLQTFSHISKLMDGKVRFVLGGDGPERETLIALSDRLEISESLSMPGLIQNPSQIFADLDLYVGLNVEEVIGIAGLEAVFSGVPVVSIQISPTYTKGANDWIWSDQDPQIVGTKIAALLADPKNLADLAKSQKSFAMQNYSIERMRDNYLNLYSAK